ncbi:MAG TPA: peptide ABC transporter substrate-binding protein [Rhizomicrobium sp.]|nr:peptide ABC transporter substrate-binding protein [Rhizomicrobium sp.]
MGRRSICAFLLAAILTACSPAAQHAGMTLNRGNIGEPKSLDPDFIDLQLEGNVVGDLLVGLVTEDAAGNPIPGAATRWETSPDGKTWTFHLRPHVWSDGTPVTSHDFAFAWRRILNPRTAANYAYNLWLFKNAQSITEGKLKPKALGVETPDDSTLILHLEHPAPYLPQLLMHETTYPLPRHVVEKYGNAWSSAEHYASNGAFMLKEWSPGDHITLVKNPRFYDAKDVHIDTLNYYPTLDSAAALRRLRAGELDTQNPLPALQIDWLRAHMADALQMHPFLGIAYIQANFAHPPLGDVRIREALCLAIDREAIVDKVYRLGESPAYGMIPKGIANYPWSPALDFASLPYADRIAKAQALMRAAGYGPQKRLSLTFETIADPDSKRFAAAIQDMLKQIYVDIDIVSVDIQIHFANLQQHNFELAGSSWVADFNDASNFLDILRWNSGNNYGHYHNPAYDAMLDEAQEQTDVAKRGAMLRAAEQIAMNDYAWIPVRFMVTRDLVQPYVNGWISNVRNVNRSRWLFVGKKPQLQ